ncbi:MAG: hypothetical protein AAFR96_09205 [Planctomycetota bacterium]
MHTRSMTRGLTTTCLAAAAAFAASTAASQQAEGDPPLVDVRFQGLAEVTPAPKDADAHATLMSLGSRLRLLPREVPDMDFDRTWIDSLWRLGTASGALTIYADEPIPAVSLSLAPEGGTEGIMPSLAEILDHIGSDEHMRNEDGSLRIELDDEWLHISGVRIEGRDALSFRIGDEPNAQLTPQRFGLPANAEPVVSMSIELGAMLGMLEDLIRDEDPDAFDQIDQFGFLDAGDAALTFATGTSGETGFAAGRLTEARPWLGRFIGDGSFELDDLQAVPADATAVVGASFEPAWIADIINAISEQTGRDLLAQVRDGFGIDLEEGLLNNVGPRWMYYLSDSTGGGGVLSLVLIAEVRDEEAFLRTQAAAMVHANQFGSALARGYARTREWTLGDRTVWSAVFPGLPVPIEPTWTIADGKLIAALTPIGLSGAVGQLESDTSVTDNAAFRRALGDRWPADPVAQFAFTDTARFARKGYGGASLAASALSNAARQPFNMNAEPGMVMPSFAALTDGIVPAGVTVSWSGDDLVLRGTADASALVQIAATLGQSSGWQSYYSPAMGLGVLLPALGKARESARQMQSSVQLRGIITAAIVYETDNPGKPITIDALIDRGAITRDLLSSPTGSAWDGGPDIVFRNSADGSEIGSFDATLIIAMDRAMYVNGEDVVNIGFADAHVEAVSYWDIDDYLDMPKNAGLREEWDLD